ncbi:MAG: PEP-CTERM sorting domain-containing protein [Sedimentisphaerales bacterium]
MKRLITTCLFRARATTLVAMLALAVLLSTQTIVSAVTPVTPLPTKWTQMPDLENGTAWSSSNGWYIAADDYLCENPLPVNDVHWWGSYWAGQDPQPINGFTIRFFSDVPASPTGEFSHPGDLLYQAYIAGNCNETYYGNSEPYGLNVYQYNAILLEPFEQDYGTTYWLSIQLNPGWTEPPYWGWYTSADHWQDIAVQAEEPSPWNWYQAIDSANQDLAFQLTVVPEPATICLLGLGALSLIRRKRSV